MRIEMARSEGSASGKWHLHPHDSSLRPRCLLVARASPSRLANRATLSRGLSFAVAARATRSRLDRAGPDQNGFCRARQRSIEEQAPIKWVMLIEQAPIDGL